MHSYGISWHTIIIHHNLLITLEITTTKVHWSTVILASLVRVWASKGATLLRTIFQSTFRALSEQFQGSFLPSFHCDKIGFFFSKIVLCGNFCLVSARLSLEIHYPLTYYFQSSFEAVSEQFQSRFLPSFHCDKIKFFFQK